MTPARVSIIGSIVRKDMVEYSRDKLWVFLSALVIAVMVGLFWILPDQVTESISLGISTNGDNSIPLGFEGSKELALVRFATSADLRSVVAGDANAWRTGDTVTVVSVGSEGPGEAEKVPVVIGIGFPNGFLNDVRSEIPVRVEVFTTTDIPESTTLAIETMVERLTYQITGIELPVTVTSDSFKVLGEDRVGNQVSIRQNLRPMFVFMALLMEMFAMSALISREIQEKTATALLVTPARIGDLLAAKILSGAVSGFGQAAILLIALGAIGANPAGGLVLMALGAVMVAGTAMIAGSSGRDFIGTLFYGMLFMFPLLVPALAVVFPGTPPLWIRALPSYPLVDGLVQNVTYQHGALMSQIGLLAIWCVVIAGIGWVVLKRRVEAI